MLPSTTEILIVGAGPTGTALAIQLQKAGISHLLIDKLPQGQNTSRAAVVHAHTLDMLAELGVSETLVDRGLKLSKFAIRDRDRPLLQLSFDGLPSPHSYLLMVTQDVTEAVLTDRLTALGGHVHRGVAATAFKTDAERVRATLCVGEQEHIVEARYIIGADGMHSVVREAADIGFDGKTYAESFVLADVHMDWPLGAEEVSMFFSPAGLVVVAPLPSGAFRIVATCEIVSDQPSLADIQTLIDERGPSEARAMIKDVVWGSRFRIHHRLAQTYRNGPMLLMGDAAHVHSPAGGQGMNTGLVDAVVLGQLLTDVLRGVRPESALDTYEALRRPAAEKVLAMAGNLTHFATMTSRPKRALRNAMLSVLNLLPPGKRRIAMNFTGLTRADHAKLPPVATGSDLPFVPQSRVYPAE